MPQFHPTEIELYRRMYEDRDCAALQVNASISKGIGVTVIHEGRPVGWWYVASGKLCYRAFPGASNIVEANGIDLAVKATAAMARKRLWRKPLETGSGLRPV